MEKCEHYWIIPNTPEGTCQGVCRKCDARREFLNQMPGNENRGTLAPKTVRVTSGGQYIAEIVGE